MLQDLFDDLSVISLAAQGAVLVFYERWKPIRSPEEIGLPPGSMTVSLRFVWPDARYQFVTHCYVTPDGNLAKSGMLDPKTLRYGGEVLFRSIPSLMGKES